jgi:tyrosyl-tRNA synthetase
MKKEVKEMVDLIAKDFEEILTLQDLNKLVESGQPLNHYIGFEISGKLHIGSGLMSALHIKNLQQAGVNCRVFLADWHSWINDKLDGDIDTIKRVAVGYFKEAIKTSLMCVGADPNKVKFILGSDLYEKDSEFWRLLVDVSKNLTLSRVMKSTTIMGRKEGMSIAFGKLLYPPMQVADIFMQDINIAHAGLDQRKAHVIAREVAENISVKPLLDANENKFKPVCLHHHLILGLGKPPIWPIKDNTDLQSVWSAMKMSKSKPDTCVFIHDSPEEVRDKIHNAFCPERNINFNPVLDWAKHLVFPIQDKLVIKRQKEHGGDINFNNFKNLQNAFKGGQLHPLDLKNAMAESITEILKPARDHFKNSENNKLLKEMEKLV